MPAATAQAPGWPASRTSASIPRSPSAWATARPMIPPPATRTSGERCTAAKGRRRGRTLDGVSTPRERLAAARLYLCTAACDDALLRAALRGGVDVVQLRDRALDDDGIRRAAERFRRAAD